jgi:hypothetical protein
MSLFQTVSFTSAKTGHVQGILKRLWWIEDGEKVVLSIGEDLIQHIFNWASWLEEIHTSWRCDRLAVCESSGEMIHL